jgi:hypothetical protein
VRVSDVDAYDKLMWGKTRKIRGELSKEMLEPFKKFGMRENDIAELLRISRVARRSEHDFFLMHSVRSRMIKLGYARDDILIQLRRRVRALRNQS